MAEIKMTKNELRSQQNKLNQLLKYLPTLQLKKALLQAVVVEARNEVARLEDEFHHERHHVEEFAALLTIKSGLDIEQFVKIKNITKHYENIAGAEVPYYEDATFEPLTYDLFDTPVWIESAISGLQNMNRVRAKITVAEEKQRILERELREVTIRVNLFEKILIPRCEANIKKIKVFLGDLQLAAVSQAKVAKAKILERKMNQELSEASR